MKTDSTLDFPWGHTRLNLKDFQRYIKNYRPKELEVALNFYNYNLNRMTIHDLKSICKKLDLTILSFIEWSSNEDFKEIGRKVLKQTKIHYQTVTVNDLISRTICLLLRK